MLGLRPCPGGAEPEPSLTPLQCYQRERGRLFATAYRMLGSVLEAEDVVQEAYLRWHRVDGASVLNPSAFLNRIVRRLALNVLSSASRRRIDYHGLTPPEPGGADAEVDPLSLRERTERLSAGLQLVLERLSPVERAVFLLRECFGYSYAEIAGLVHKTEDNCRQIESRARRHLRYPGERRPAGSSPRHSELLDRFVRAAREGEVEELVCFLVEDALAYAARRSRLPPDTVTNRSSSWSHIPGGGT